MKRKGEVHDEAAKGAVPRWVGQGQEGSRRLLAPALNGKKGRRAGGGPGLKGLGGRGRWLYLEGGNCGHPSLSPAGRGLFGREGNKAGAGWAG